MATVVLDDGDEPVADGQHIAADERQVELHLRLQRPAPSLPRLPALLQFRQLREEQLRRVAGMLPGGRTVGGGWWMVGGALEKQCSDLHP